MKLSKKPRHFAPRKRKVVAWNQNRSGGRMSGHEKYKLLREIFGSLETSIAGIFAASIRRRRVG